MLFIMAPTVVFSMGIAQKLTEKRYCEACLAVDRCSKAVDKELNPSKRDVAIQLLACNQSVKRIWAEKLITTYPEIYFSKNSDDVYQDIPVIDPKGIRFPAFSRSKKVEPVVSATCSCSVM